MRTPGTGRSASIGRRLPLLALLRPDGAVGWVGAVVLDAAGAPAHQPVAALARRMIAHALVVGRRA